MALIIQQRKKQPNWGPKKIQDILARKHGLEGPPARSTIASTLNQQGLIRRRRRKPGLYRPLPSELTEAPPNHVWTFDFKGRFLTADRIRCDPLTVCERFSHYIVGCKIQFNQQFKSTSWRHVR